MKTKLASFAIALILFAGNASAALIEGSISWSGTWDRAGSIITFDSVGVLTTAGDLTVLPLSTDFAPVDIDIANFVPTVLWTAGDFTLTLNRLNVVLDMALQSLTVLTGSALMTHSGQGFEPTHFDVQLSTNMQSFSGAAVPEPMTAVMMSSGLLALVTLRRRRIRA